jgi:N-acetylmuramoyl-L-alanine amidase
MERVIFLVLIYLDAGHGGKDSGASSNGIKEKDIVLKLVKKMKALLGAYQGVTVATTRETDVFLSLDERTQKANKLNADVLLSIHCNSATDSSAKGFESYRYPNAGASTIAFQNVLHAEIIRAIGTGIQDRGKKTANFHMLRESKMKAILTENLFVSNSGDASKLKDDSFLDKIAQGHVTGLEKFLGLKRKVERPPQTNEPTKPTGDLYKVQVGAFSEKKNAEELVSDLEKIGHKPFITYDDKLYKVQVGAFSEKANAEKLAEILRKEGYRPFIYSE